MLSGWSFSHSSSLSLTLSCDCSYFIRPLLTSGVLWQSFPFTWSWGWNSWESTVCVCVSQVHHLPPGCKRMIKLASSALASLSHLILFSLLALCRKCVWVRHPAESCCPASSPTRPRGRGEERKSSESWGEMWLWLQVFGFRQVCRPGSCAVCMCDVMGMMCYCLNSYQQHTCSRSSI